ncbi:hypothetical protein DKM44_08805 [Deinococcus irradiatisoli]|uniref:Uncharacterized protein n=1 Tax=Deinococcus irradiatisoli TaxID=2202254 RepID=A0A2Z3JDS1_9DEIO|nr:hypothetical protein [Deinococcus irradiatisoli]AWN23317.1 hypothetical protein DKM44_08805 [Deinococcus irradiatisoli]
MNEVQGSAQEIFGVVFVELINPGGGSPRLPGWTTRLWPVARLGDQTLEARPSGGSVSRGGVDDLLRQLRGAGLTPLGVRLRPQVLSASRP